MNHKPIVIDPAPAPNPRRDFLRLAAAPLGTLLLDACGGGGAPTATAQSAPVTTASAAAAVSSEATPAPAPAPAPTPVPSPAPAPAPAPQPPAPDASPANPQLPSGPVPAWVSNLPLWQWYEIPNTALSSIDPAVRALGSTGPSAKIDAWCGAALKRSGSVYMLGAAGGHSDYAGNEVNALALNVAAPQWVELKGPTPNAEIIGDTQFFLDNRPSPTHTYYASQFIESLNRLMVFGSQGVTGPFPAPPSGFPYVGVARSFSFNVAAGDWDGPDYVAQFPGTGTFIAALCVKHPWTDDVYYSRTYGDGWYRWTRVSNSWTRLSGMTRLPWFAGAAIDPLRNRMLVVGCYSATAPEVHNLDGSSVAVSFTGLGASALALTGYPGVIYDEALDRYVVLYNAGGSVKVLRVDPQTWLVDDPLVGGTAPAARPNGIQNSVQYVPELKGFVLANSHGGNVWFVRTAA